MTTDSLPAASAPDPDSFARDWIAAWNSHDLERILSHYSEDVVFRSPLVTALLGIPDGVLRGRTALRDYFARGLDTYPDLRFHFHEALSGVDSIGIRYRSVGDRESIEVMEFGKDGLVARVTALYSGLPG